MLYTARIFTHRLNNYGLNMSPRAAAPFTIEHVLLALLDAHPTHGYDLYQSLRQEPGITLIWNVKQSLFYAMLDRLEQHGWLAAHVLQGEAYPPRNQFALTEEGRAALNAWMVRPVRRARDMRQEFLARLIIARRYGKARVLLLAQQQTCLAWQTQLRDDLARPVSTEAVSTLAAADDADRSLVLSYRARRVESILAWLSDFLEELPDA